MNNFASILFRNVCVGLSDRRRMFGLSCFCARLYNYKAFAVRFYRTGYLSQTGIALFSVQNFSFQINILKLIPIIKQLKWHKNLLNGKELLKLTLVVTIRLE